MGGKEDIAIIGCAIQDDIEAAARQQCPWGGPKIIDPFGR